VSECLLTSEKFSVERRTATLPGSAPHTFDVVVHPGAVVVLPLLDDRRIVMIRNTRYTVGEELWELPAGTAEPGEPPLQTAQRELGEETGYTTSQLTLLGEFYTSPGFTDELMRAFLATDLRPTSRDLDANEKIEVEIVALDRVRRMLTSGELRDAKTITTLGMFFLR
jgi:ADP-ribose pyrophosphatase